MIFEAPGRFSPKREMSSSVGEARTLEKIETNSLFRRRLLYLTFQVVLGSRGLTNYIFYTKLESIE